MMKRLETAKERSPLFLFAAGFFFFSLWVCNKTPAADSKAEEPTGIVKGQTKQGYGYMSGGIGTEERDAMGKEAGSYNLKLSFATTTGQYIMKAEVMIKDQKGQEIINTTSGPWFYIKLPPGKYTIETTFAGDKKEIKDLGIGEGKSVSRHLQWKADRS